MFTEKESRVTHLTLKCVDYHIYIICNAYVPFKQVFLKDLKWGRQQQQSFWKKLHFRKVENAVHQTLQMLEKDS